jgi:membrane associated rhomboid family serine protease
VNDPAQPFLQVVHGLVAGEGAPGEVLLGLRDDAAFVLMHDQTVAIVINPSKRGRELEEVIRKNLDADRTTHLKLVIIGGGADMREVLTRVQPGMLSRRMVQAYHLGADGTVWSGRSSSLDTPVGRVLQAVAEQKDTRTIAFDELAQLVPRVSEQEHAEARSAFEFVQEFRARKPTLTRAFVIALAAVFGLELLWGGSEYLPTLARMGANTEASLGDEPWRLLSSVLLHGGEVHLGVNAFVLWVLGGEMERILGWARLAVLLVVAGLVGSIASALMSEAVLSVGASGAIWGVLAAAGAIAWRPRGLLPTAIVHRMRRAAGINLIINLAASFLPQVDLWAHLGGGVAGAALVLSGVLTRGLTPLHDETPSRDPPAMRWIAWGSLALLGAALATAIVVGKPWQLVQQPSVVQREIAGFSVELPEVLGEPEMLEEGDVTEMLAGDLEDPFFALVRVQDHPPGDTIELPDGPDGAEVSVERHAIEDAAVPTVEERWVYPNGVEQLLRYAQFHDALVTIDILWLPGAPERWVAAGEHTASSLGSRR